MLTDYSSTRCPESCSECEHDGKCSVSVEAEVEAPAAEGLEVVAWRYVSSNGVFLYRGARRDFDKEYPALLPDGLVLYSDAIHLLTEQDASIEMLRRERNVLQKICAHRADCLEAAGLHSDCTVDEASQLRAELARLRTELLSAKTDVLTGLLGKVAGMRETSYTFGEYNKSAVEIAFDCVAEAINDAMKGTK